MYPRSKIFCNFAAVLAEHLPNKHFITVIMNKKTLRIKAATIRWHQFSRKSDAVFRSLGREIVISTLSVATLLFATPQTAQAQTTAKNPAQAEREQMLDEVEVTAARLPLPMEQTARLVSVMTHEQIKDCPAQSVNDLLKYAASVDVQQRGAFGIQTDISINGGTHDQIVILLNGVYFSSPHTGHLAADLPISIDDIERIEILEGAASRVYGTSAFSGAINIVTREGNQRTHPLAPPYREGSGYSSNGDGSSKTHFVNGGVSLQGGSFGTFGTDGRVGVQTPLFSHSLSSGYTQSDGGTDNSDFKKFRAFYQGNYSPPLGGAGGGSVGSPVGGSLSWQLGFSRQDYGANTFYSGKYPDQYEENRRYSAAVNLDNHASVFTLHSSLYFNRANDHYQLIRGTSTGENYHQTDVYGLTLNAHVDWALGTTSLGADLRNEGILSSALGRPMANSVSVGSSAGKRYTKKDNRTNLCYFLEHDILLRRWTFSLGVMANMNTGLDHRFRLYPGIDISYRPSSLWRLYASWNTAQRMPTFTDLYYRSPTQEGNVGLKPEETSELSVGSSLRMKGVNSSVKLFYRHNSSMIDWVLTPADSVNNYTTYHATNFRLDNMGLTLSAEIPFSSSWLRLLRLNRNQFSLQYTYLYQRRRDHQEVYASSYALDYLRQKLVLRLDTQLAKHLSTTLTYRWQERMGSFVRYTAVESDASPAEYVATKQRYRPYSLLDLRVNYAFFSTLLSQKGTDGSLFLEVSNLTNHRYYDLGNVLQPGIWLMTGVKIRF